MDTNIGWRITRTKQGDLLMTSRFLPVTEKAGWSLTLKEMLRRLPNLNKKVLVGGTDGI